MKDKVKFHTEGNEKAGGLANIGADIDKASRAQWLTSQRKQSTKCADLFRDKEVSSTTCRNLKIVYERRAISSREIATREHAVRPQEESENVCRKCEAKQTRKMKCQCRLSICHQRNVQD